VKNGTHHLHMAWETLISILAFSTRFHFQLESRTRHSPS